MKRVLYKLSFIPYFIVAFCCIAFFLTSFDLSWTIHDFSEELFSFLCSCSWVIESPVPYLVIVSCALFQYFYRKGNVKVDKSSNGIDSGKKPSKANELRVLFYLSLVPYILGICFALLLGGYIVVLAGFFSPVFLFCLSYQIYFFTYAVEKYNIKINVKAIMCDVGLCIAFIILLFYFGEV